MSSIPEPIRDVKPKYTQLFINNEWHNSASGKTFETKNPATLQVNATIQEADKADVDKAVIAAKAAFAIGSTWRRMDASERGKLINKWATLVERDQIFIASLESKDNGGIFALMYNMTLMAVKALQYNAGWADKIEGTTPAVDGPFFCYTRVEPIGVSAIILPWNAPMLLFCMKVSAALAAGCTVVVKPSEFTPSTALHLAALVKEAGFPPGVVNVVPGYGATAGNALAYHMDVSKISFTGSTVVGKSIQKASAESNLKKVNLELGGKSPVVVFADADLDQAVELAHNAVMLHSGQICVAGSRTYVQEDIYDKFVEKSTERAKKRTTGDPFQLTTENGPQVNEVQMNRVLSYIESGVQEGARLMTGGKRVDGANGYFIQPTVFADVIDTMKIAREEIFGPVQQIIKFKTIEEVIPRANNTSYGLAAAVFTKDIDKALMIANSVEAGSVYVNQYGSFPIQAPFGGYKQSGIGREMAEDGIKEYCQIKSVVIKIADKIC